MEGRWGHVSISKYRSVGGYQQIRVYFQRYSPFLELGKAEKGSLEGSPERGRQYDICLFKEERVGYGNGGSLFLTDLCQCWIWDGPIQSLVLWYGCASAYMSCRT